MTVIPIGNLFSQVDEKDENSFSGRKIILLLCLIVVMTLRVLRFERKKKPLYSVGSYTWLDTEISCAGCQR